MGYLWHVFLAVGVQAFGEGDYGSSLTWPLCVPLLALVPLALGALGRRRALAGDFQSAARIVRLVHSSPPLLHFVAVAGFGWVRSVRAWTGSELTLLSWPEPALMLAFMPFIVFELAAIFAESRMHEERPAARRSWRAFHVRMLVSSLLPIGLYVLLAAVVGWNEVLRVHVERVALWNAMFVTVLLLFLAFLLPTLIKNTWETAPFPASPQRDLLRLVAGRADFHARDLLVWKTGHQLANAAIVGFLPRARTVLLSDSLLSMLSMRELAAVFGHEIGHAKRHHVLFFFAFALVFFLGGHLLGAWIDPEGGWPSIVVLVLTVATWFTSFGWLSRRFELEADLYSLQLLGDERALIGALERVGGRLRDVASWRHFSTSERVTFIERAAREADFAPRFRARLRRFSMAGVVLAGIFIALEVAGLARTFGEDRVWAELSLGRYSRAVEHAEGRQDLDEELVSLLERAGSLGAETVAPSKLTELLEVALSEGRAGEALDFAQLAILRGRHELLPLAEGLDALLAGNENEARAALEHVEEPWRRRAASMLGGSADSPQ